jgi:hypothetical protein
LREALRILQWRLRDDMATDVRNLRFDGIHCNLAIEKPSAQVVVMKIAGTDVGEFGDAPMKALDEWIEGSSPVHLFIDAREVRGASIEVSGEWAGWLTAHKPVLQSVTMLTGSRFIQITAEFVRRFASLEGSMRICTDEAVFDQALLEASGME